MDAPLSGAYQWSHGMGGSSDDVASGVAVAHNGDIDIAGTFRGVVDLGGGPMKVGYDHGVLSAGYDLAGAHVWSDSFGGDGDHEASGMAVDLEGNIVVGGTFTGTLEFGDSVLESAGSWDAFVAKLGPTGEPLWALRLGGPSGDSTSAVAVDGQGDIYVAAISARTPEGADPLVPAQVTDDVLMARISPDGVTRWTRSQGSLGEEHALGIAVGGGGRVAVVGSFTDATSLGGAWLESAGGKDGFVAVYGGAGNLLWSVRIGGPGDDAVTAVAFDAHDRLLVGGHFSGGAQMGEVTRVSEGEHDMFVAAFAPGPQVAWSRSIGGPGDEDLTSLAAQPDGAMAAAGSFTGSLTVGDSELVSAGGADALVVRMKANGKPAWTHVIGGPADDVATGVAFRPDGGVAAVGWYHGRVDLGGGHVDSYGGRDLFVVSLGR